jgi:hypothetical protein
MQAYVVTDLLTLYDSIKKKTAALELRLNVIEHSLRQNKTGSSEQEMTDIKLDLAKLARVVNVLGQSDFSTKGDVNLIKSCIDIPGEKWVLDPDNVHAGVLYEGGNEHHWVDKAQVKVSRLKSTNIF